MLLSCTIISKTHEPSSIKLSFFLFLLLLFQFWL